ncbi:MAG TPA: SH3 domain-containing protein [Candidatus Limnocylindrales bacterium]
MLGTTHGRTVVATARALVLVVAAVGAGIGGAFVAASPVAAAGPKVVVVVGPTNGATATYISRAKVIAAQARSLGASVTEIYTPRATWARVSAAAQGAKLFVYLGHGSGYPSPYTFDKTKSDGMGLNPVDGTGTTSPVKYYGESLIASTIRFAPGGVVLLNHLCYASGSSEPGRAEPSWSVAQQRVDNYAAGFIGAGASAVIADAYTDVAFEVRAVLTGANLLTAWRTDPNFNNHERAFASVRRPGFTNHLDPLGAASTFYRAITTTNGFSTATPAALRAATSTTALLRGKPSETATVVTSVPKAAVLPVIGRLVWDSKGRTWAPVRTSTGKTGYIAAWLVHFGGSAVAIPSVIVRATPSLTGRAVETIAAGKRMTVLGSVKDSGYRVWLSVRSPSGHTGWVAAWLTKP